MGRLLVNSPTKRRLCDLRGVGRSIEANLKRLGINSVQELAAANPDKLYAHLGQLEGTRQDPCVLDTFRCAIAQARDPELPANQRDWWWWSAQRKEGLL